MRAHAAAAWSWVEKMLQPGQKRLSTMGTLSTEARQRLTGPGNFSTKSGECLDKDGSLDCPVCIECRQDHQLSVIAFLRKIGRAGWAFSHVEAADDAGALERLAGAVLGSQVHEAWQSVSVVC